MKTKREIFSDVVVEFMSRDNYCSYDKEEHDELMQCYDNAPCDCDKFDWANAALSWCKSVDKRNKLSWYKSVDKHNKETDK